MGGAPVLDGRCSMDIICNNQTNDGVGGGGLIGEEIRTGGTGGGGRSFVVLGDEWSDEKN
jgi:hypothetical protein